LASKPTHRLLADEHAAVRGASARRCEARLNQSSIDAASSAKPLGGWTTTMPQPVSFPASRFEPSLKSSHKG
jgi:hypothetical protein